MVSFGKTEDLEPGESVELDLSFPFEELKLVNSAGDEVVLSQTSANYYIFYIYECHRKDLHLHTQGIRAVCPVCSEQYFSMAGQRVSR